MIRAFIEQIPNDINTETEDTRLPLSYLTYETSIMKKAEAHEKSS